MKSRRIKKKGRTRKVRKQKGGFDPKHEIAIKNVLLTKGIDIPSIQKIIGREITDEEWKLLVRWNLEILREPSRRVEPCGKECQISQRKTITLYKEPNLVEELTKAVAENRDKEYARKLQAEERERVADEVYARKLQDEERVAASAYARKLQDEERVAASAMPTEQTTWTCPRCTLINSDKDTKCIACLTPKPTVQQVDPREYSGQAVHAAYEEYLKSQPK